MRWSSTNCCHDISVSFLLLFLPPVPGSAGRGAAVFQREGVCSVEFPPPLLSRDGHPLSPFRSTGLSLFFAPFHLRLSFSLSRLSSSSTVRRRRGASIRMNTRPEGRPTARPSRRRVRASNQSIDQCLFSTLQVLSRHHFLWESEIRAAAAPITTSKSAPCHATRRSGPSKRGAVREKAKRTFFSFQVFFLDEKMRKQIDNRRKKKPGRSNGSRKQRPCSCSCSSSSLCSSFLSERRSPIHEWTWQRCRRRRRSRSGSASAPATASATADGLAESPRPPPPPPPRPRPPSSSPATPPGSAPTPGPSPRSSPRSRPRPG